MATVRERESAVRRACAYLEERVGERVSLAELAQHAGLERFALLRAFRTHVGVSPHRYQLALRVAVARRLLEREDAPVVEIAAVLGFADQSHFGRWFRRIVGSTPGEYRRRSRSR